MQDDPGSEQNRAPLHRSTRTNDKAPTILEYSLKQFQTFPKSLRASEQWWKHILSHCALRKALKRLTYLLSKADIDSVMVLIDERRIGTASN